MTESSTLARIELADRFWADLMKIAEFTEPGKPYTRRSFSPFSGSPQLVEGTLRSCWIDR